MFFKHKWVGVRCPKTWAIKVLTQEFSEISPSLCFVTLARSRLLLLFKISSVAPARPAASRRFALAHRSSRGYTSILTIPERVGEAAREGLSALKYQSLGGSPVNSWVRTFKKASKIGAFDIICVEYCIKCVMRWKGFLRWFWAWPSRPQHEGCVVLLPKQRFGIKYCF